ncbi:hypothetical protein ACHHYP_01977 [Achlya hypogyna]|uniref:Uncharacterized protein n=1 Tax=Achlya hypogyna TaxID=1202772 RepID=A0A1V9Z7S5_ACHHY|nr:hypothetical protein ACHHYP_01977 [Achlya hypogyna]
MVGLALRNPFGRRTRSASLPEDDNQLLKPSELPPKRLSSTIVEQVPKHAKLAPPQTPEEEAHPAPTKKTPMSLKAAFASTSGYMYKKLSFRPTPDKAHEGDEQDWESEPADSIFAPGTVVATKYGTAVVLEYRPHDHFYVVKTFWHATAFFNAETVVREVVCMIGDRVKTRWGMATVENYYLDDDMYGIALDWRWDDDHVWRMKATTKMFTLVAKNPKSRAQITKELMQKTAAVGYSSLRTSTSSLRSSTSSSYSSLVTKMASISTTIAPSPKPQQDVKPRVAVWTPYGEGRVLGVRAADGMAKVKLRAGAVAYMLATSLEPLPYGTTDFVATIFGDGYVSSYRHSDTMYTVVVGSPGITLFTCNITSLLPPATPPVAAPTVAASLLKALPKVPFSAPKMFQSLPAGLPASLPSARKDKYVVGDRLRSKFGTATIMFHRADDDVFGCALDSAPSMLFVPGANMDSVFTDALNPTKMTALLQMTFQATKSLQTSTVQSATVLQKTVKDKWEASLKKRPKFAVDDRVLCGAFGSGFVLDARPDGGSYVYHVKLRKLGIEGHFHESALRHFPYDRATHVIVGEKHVSVPMEAYQEQYKKSRSEIIKDSMAANKRSHKSVFHI